MHVEPSHWLYALWFPKLLVTFLAWANGKGKHWSHILTKNNSPHPNPQRKKQGTS
jgi:hypothetical protein